MDEIEKLRILGKETAARERAEMRDLTGDFLFTCASSEEAGDAKLFIHLYRDRLVFDHQQALWHRYVGPFWVPCELNEPLALVGSLADLYGEAAKKEFFRAQTAAKAGRKLEADQAQAREKVFLNKIAKLQRRLHRQNVLALAAAGEGSLGVTGREWDSRPLLLPCANGVLDLETGHFRDGRPDDFITKYCQVPWKGFDAAAPRWEDFIFEIMGDDSEKAAFLQRLLGSCITGRQEENVLPVLWGSGRNGKTLMFEVLGHIMGPLAGPVPAEMLMQQKQPRSAAAPSPDIVGLKGMRLVWASESDEGRHLNSAKVKWLVGGDTLVGRGPYDRRMIIFQPSHSLMLVTNFRPHGNPRDEALWARVLSIRFPFSFVDNPAREHERPRDPQLAEKLKREASGILAWLVKGFYAWQEKGLCPPSSVLDETCQYRHSEDSVGNFLEERCIEIPNVSTRASELYEAYEDYCQVEGYKARSRRSFFQFLKEKYAYGRDKKSIYYTGLSLKD